MAFALSRDIPVATNLPNYSRKRCNVSLVRHRPPKAGIPSIDIKRTSTPSCHSLPRSGDDSSSRPLTLYPRESPLEESRTQEGSSPDGRVCARVCLGVEATTVGLRRCPTLPLSCLLNSSRSPRIPPSLSSLACSGE